MHLWLILLWTVILSSTLIVMTMATNNNNHNNNISLSSSSLSRPPSRSRLLQGPPQRVGLGGHGQGGGGGGQSVVTVVREEVVEVEEEEEEEEQQGILGPGAGVRGQHVDNIHQNQNQQQDSIAGIGTGAIVSRRFPNGRSNDPNSNPDTTTTFPTKVSSFFDSATTTAMWKVVGIVIGTVVGVVILLGIVVLTLQKRKRQGGGSKRGKDGCQSLSDLHFTMTGHDRYNTNNDDRYFSSSSLPSSNGSGTSFGDRSWVSNNSDHDSDSDTSGLRSSRVFNSVFSKITRSRQQTQRSLSSSGLDSSGNSLKVRRGKYFNKPTEQQTIAFSTSDYKNKNDADPATDLSDLL
mmetsp:Transcript_49228/g.56768  ORF Transcript_49228/g.56768 Transcript_49228/m.56768 type:complete len:349 (+) Transcript_49228:103-1149(+)